MLKEYEKLRDDIVKEMNLEAQIKEDQDLNKDTDSNLKKADDAFSALDDKLKKAAEGMTNPTSLTALNRLRHKLEDA